MAFAPSRRKTIVFRLIDWLIKITCVETDGPAGLC